jgi:hypothetical protein
MSRRVLIASVLVCVLAGVASSAAGAGHVHASPVVSKVAPLDLTIGETLTITGKGFLPGHYANTVVFMRENVKPVFVKADDATKTRITLVVPDKLSAFLTQKGGKAAATRFRLRVLGKRLSKDVTKKGLSPIIKPPKDDGSGGGGAGGGGSSGGSGSGNAAAPASAPAPAGTAPGAAADPRGPQGDCDHDGVPNSQETDADNDGLSDTEEAKWHTDPCNPDTDRDGVPDGYEVDSAIDLNHQNGTPTTSPAADPLKPDATTDYDHDGLTLGEEYALSVRYPDPPYTWSYSDGKQYTTANDAVPAGKGYLDLNGNGRLSDDEKDADGDGLGNYVEINFSSYNFPKTASAVHPDPNIQPLDYLNPDSDGDGTPDGADDQDHDDLSNLQEITVLHSDPRDPCDPDHGSANCYLHP